MNRNKEDAIAVYMEMVKNAWTWQRLTEKERNRFEHTVVDNDQRIKGNFDARWNILSLMYTSFLNALGYEPIGWRESNEDDLPLF